MVRILFGEDRMRSWLLLEQTPCRQLPVAPIHAVTSTLRSLPELKEETWLLGPGRAPLLTLPSSPLQNIFLYCFLWSRSVTALFGNFLGEPRVEDGGAEPNGFPGSNICSASIQFSGLLMSKFLLRTRGAGLGQGALPLAVNEYFQNRALTFLKESILAVLLEAHLSWASPRLPCLF